MKKQLKCLTPNSKVLNINYFRTGDLGFAINGELFIAGRLKELLIVNGKKYYPNDLEKTLKTALAQLQFMVMNRVQLL